MRKITPDELLCESEIKKRKIFNSAIKEIYRDSFTLPEIIKSNSDDTQDDDGAFDLSFDEVAPEIPKADIIDAKGQPLHPSYEADILINTEELLPQGEDMRLSKFIRRNVDSDGKVIGD